MSRPDRSHAPPRSAPAPGAEGEAFDLWLRQALRRAHDETLAEPVPEALLALLPPRQQPSC